MLLGWSLDDKTEVFTRQEMIDLFSLERVNKAAASFDAKKLFAFQERYMQRLPIAEKVERALPYLTRAGLVAEPDAARPLVAQIVAHAGPRLVVAGDVLDYAYFFLPDDRLPYDDKAFDKHIRKAPELLRKARAVLAAAEPFDAATLKARVEEFAAAEGVKHGPVSQMLRVAVTGKEVGFGAYETLATLGKERRSARIDRRWGACESTKAYAEETSDECGDGYLESPAPTAMQGWGYSLTPRAGSSCPCRSPRMTSAILSLRPRRHRGGCNLDELARQLHDRATRGELLSAEERALLDQWYARQDREESAALAATVPPASAAALQAQVDAALAQLVTATQRIQTLAAENEAVRKEIADLQRQLARKPAVQSA